MPEATPRERFQASLDRCSTSPDFLPSFYERLFASSSEIRSKFKDTDFATQNQMLLRSLQLSAGATSGDRDSLRELRERAETHDRHHLDVAPPLYQLWLDAVIATAQEFDPNWDDAVEAAWRTTLGHVVSVMAKNY